jgi:hypothetical protein
MKSNAQWVMNQPHGFKCPIQALEVDQQCFLAFPSHWVHESGRIGDGLNYGICERWKNFLDLEIILQNRLWEHLDFVVQMFAQLFFIVDKFLSIMILL